MRRKLFVFVVLSFSVASFLVSIVLSGCSKSSTTPVESPLIPSSTAQTQFDSPISILPSPTVIIPLGGPSFEIEGPLVEGASQVRGKGPYNVPIVIVDVTMMAKPLGTGIITPDGTFSIDIVPELIVNHRIGIMAGMSEGATPAPSADAYLDKLKHFKGEGFQDLPNIGIVFTSDLVESSQ